MFDEMPGALGPTGSGEPFTAIHADWPAYPGDHHPNHALLRLADFPLGTEFTCLSIIDQAALLVAEVGIRETDRFSAKHMHVSVWLNDLIDLDDRGLINGLEIDASLTEDQLHFKRTVGVEMWDELRSGRQRLFRRSEDGTMLPLALPPDQEDDEEDYDPWEDLRVPQRVAIFPETAGSPGTKVSLRSDADAEVERVAKLALEIPNSIQDRLGTLLGAGLFDSAVRDLGAALEARMHEAIVSERYGRALIDDYIDALIAAGIDYPARLKSLRQELHAIFKFVRNEFAHSLIDVPPGRGYALVSRMCWHITDIEIVIDALSGAENPDS